MKLEVSLELKISTALLIAGGESASRLGIDKSTVRDRQGNLVIPASTIKGKLRDECQRILKAFKADTCFVCAPPLSENMCPQPFYKNESSVEYCLICEIFGSPWKPSRLYFSDLIFSKAPYFKELRNTTIRNGVAIDCYTRTAKDKSLFYFETSPQGFESTFKSSSLTIKGDINVYAHALILYAGIQSMFNIGGSKSTGLGWIEGGKIKLFALDGSKFEPKKEYLEALKYGE